MSQLAPRILATLSDPDRLSLFAALLSEGGATARLADDPQAVQRLRDAGLDGQRSSVAEIAELFRAALLEVQGSRAATEQVVVRAVAPAGLPFKGGRLTMLPKKQAQLDRLLDWLVTDYLEHETFDETALNAELVRLHDDPATLRRLLVDTGRLTRDPHRGSYSKRA